MYSLHERSFLFEPSQLAPSNPGALWAVAEFTSLHFHQLLWDEVEQGARVLSTPPVNLHVSKLQHAIPSARCGFPEEGFEELASLPRRIKAVVVSKKGATNL